MKKVLPTTGSDMIDSYKTPLRALLTCALLLAATFALAGCGEDVSRVEVGMVETSGLTALATPGLTMPAHNPDMPRMPKWLAYVILVATST